MNTATYAMTVIAGIAMLLGSGGCGSSTDAPAASKAGEQGFVSPGKATAAVSMNHHFSAEPAVGVPTSLVLEIAAGRNDTLHLEMHADDALAVKPFVGRRINSGETVAIDLLPMAEGRYYVNVIARLGTGSQARVRVFSVPVQVGKGTYTPTAKKATVSPDGERLIRMQAEKDLAD